jgi:AcrR family transcriptional regulator
MAGTVGDEPEAPGARRRGRPPRVTREQIVAAAAALLHERPGEPLTMARVAEQVGVSPMALYRHFQDRDELVDEVVGYVLELRNAAIPRDGSWQDQLRAWIVGGLEFLVPCAQVVQVVLAGGTTRWLHDAATLARILELAGLRDDELAEVQLWIAMSVGGYVMAEASRRRAPRLDDAYGGLAELSPEDAGRMRPLIPRLERAYGRMHESFADRIIRSVESEVGDVSGRRASTP